MPTQVQFRRGTTAQNNSFTGAAGEISINTSNNTIRVHDGSTAGGFELAKRGNVSTLTSGTSAELAAVISDETGSGALVFATSPTLVTPALGTPSSGTLTNATGLPLSSGVTGTLPVANGGTGVTASTGTGNVVLSTSPVLTTPALGTPSAIVLTSGTGLPISTGVSGLGTGIATALAVNTGSAGAPVLLNGELGTPTSGTLTNATGLPLSSGVTGTLPVANGGTGVTASTGTGSVVLSASPTFTGNVLADNLTLSGNLIVSGTTTTINSTTLTVDDKNIELGSTASPSDATADGGGITLKGTTDKTFNYVHATTAWTSSEDLNLLTGKVFEINATQVLSSSGLGSGILASNLTSVGTISSGTWNGSVIDGQYGGTGVANTGKTITLGGNFTTSGAFATTLTSTATTSVTLPTTGTLATLAGSETFTNKTLTSPTLVTPALGTPSSGTLTNATGLPLSSGVTGTLPVANGGTGTASPATVAGTGISVSGSFPNQTITNTGVTSAVASTGISVSGATGAVTFTNTGVTSLVAGTNISVSGATGAVTVSVTGTVSAATDATNTAITDDTSTNSTHFPTFVSASSGNAGQKTSSSKLTFNPSSGLLTSTDYNSSSDRRLKKNIKTVSNAVETINALRGVTFEWKEGGIKSAGLIAQEVEKVLPDSVSIDDNGFMGIRYNNLIGILVEAVKEQQNQINSLKQQIDKLNG